MKKILKLIGAAALVCFFAAACDKDNGTSLPSEIDGVSVIDGHFAVDLGLTTKDGKPLKWAICNVGASSQWDSGYYFAWGETETKNNFLWEKEGDYKWGVYNINAAPKFGMTKYTAGIAGGDGLKTLQPGDDPATKEWGGKWRTPTRDEIEDLLEKCIWEQIWNEDKTELKGCTFTNNGISIFLPAAGFRFGTSLEYTGAEGDYWSSSVNESNPFGAFCFSFNSLRHDCSTLDRCSGLSVRAVTDY